MRKCLAAVAIVVALAGSSGWIPNNVSPDEYGIYAEWVKAHFANNLPSNLSIGRRTFAFDPL